MANYADAEIVYYVEDEKFAPELNRLYKDVQAALSTPSRRENTWNPPEKWLGNLVDFFGGDPFRIPCRGKVTELCEPEDNGKAFRMYVEEAWNCYHVGFMKQVLSRNYPFVSVVYKVEEPGGCVFVNTDTLGRYISDRFCVDYSGFDKNQINGPEDDTEYFETFGKMQEYLNKIFGHAPESEDDIDFFVSRMQRHSDDRCFAVRVFA